MPTILETIHAEHLAKVERERAPTPWQVEDAEIANILAGHHVCEFAITRFYDVNVSFGHASPEPLEIAALEAAGFRVARRWKNNLHRFLLTRPLR